MEQTQVVYLSLSELCRWEVSEGSQAGAEKESVVVPYIVGNPAPNHNIDQ